MADTVIKLDREVDCYRDAIDVLHGFLAEQTLFEWIEEQRDPNRDGGRVAWRTIRDVLRDRTNIKLPDVTLIRWYDEITEAESEVAA